MHPGHRQTVATQLFLTRRDRPTDSTASGRHQRKYRFGGTKDLLRITFLITFDVTEACFSTFWVIRLDCKAQWKPYQFDIVLSEVNENAILGHVIVGKIWVPDGLPDSHPTTEIGVVGVQPQILSGVEAHDTRRHIIRKSNGRRHSRPRRRNIFFHQINSPTKHREKKERAHVDQLLETRANYTVWRIKLHIRTVQSGLEKALLVQTTYQHHWWKDVKPELLRKYIV